LPEVALIAILDADKEGFLRSETALIQIVGRAARNIDGRVIMYADRITGSMERAIGETNRRREIQAEFNAANNITPKSIIKGVRDIIEATTAAEEIGKYKIRDKHKDKDIASYIVELEIDMRLAADSLEFEKAAQIRDEIKAIKDKML